MKQSTKTEQEEVLVPLSVLQKYEEIINSLEKENRELRKELDSLKNKQQAI